MNLKFWQAIKFKDELHAIDRCVLGLSEFLATAILMFVGCMGCIGYASRIYLEMYLGFGIAVLIAVQCFGHISGSHINPIVSISAVLVGFLPLIELPVYLIGQFLGSICGVGVLKLIFPSNMVDHKLDGDKIVSPGICSPWLNTHNIDHISQCGYCIIEFLISLILVIVVCAILDSRNITKTETISIRFGLVITGLAIAAAPFTGAHMNPARTLGPAIVNGDWKHLWIYLVGQYTAAFVGPILYSIIFGLPEDAKEDHNSSDV